MKIKEIIFLYAVVFSLSFKAFGQRDPIEYMPTEKINKHPSYNVMKQGKRKRAIYTIVANDTRNILSGNKCFEEFTYSRGYIYLAIPLGQSGNESGWNRFWNNQVTKFVIVLRNGPFWKLKEKKYYRKCKYGTGDFCG